MKTTKQWKRLQPLADSAHKNSSSGRFLRPHFQNSFPQIFFWFSTRNSKMCKLRHNAIMHNGQNLPHENPNFTKKLNSLYVQFKQFFNKFETTLPKQFFSKYFLLLFSTLNSRLVASQLTWVHIFTQENLILFSQNKSTIFVHKYPFQATSVRLEVATAPSPRMSNDMCIWRHKLCNAKTVQLLHGQMNLDIG